jgi:hypothetical protein
MQQVRAGRQFSLDRAPQRTPEPGESAPADGSSQQGRKVVVAWDCVLKGSGSPHPVNRNAVDDGFT